LLWEAIGDCSSDEDLLHQSELGNLRSPRVTTRSSKRGRLHVVVASGLLAVALCVVGAVFAPRWFTHPPSSIGESSEDAVDLVSVKKSSKSDDIKDELKAELAAEGIDKLDTELKEGTEEKTVKKADCEDAARGSQCYRDAMYAQDHIKAHPDWYVGLHQTSSFAAFQNFLHKQTVAGGKRRCPKPCAKVEKDHGPSIYGKCHTAQEGDDCYNHVVFTQKENLPKHPEWYPGLAKNAGFLEIQDYLHEQRVCPKPCDLEEAKKRASMTKLDGSKICKHKTGKDRFECLDRVDERSGVCHTAKPGEACYGDVLYAMSEKKKGHHESWYFGLNATSSFEQFQAFLHSQHSADSTRLCPQPCSREAVESLKHVNGGTHHCTKVNSGEECYKAVNWVMSDGIKLHPKWYVNITTNWTFEKVQARLAKDKKGACSKLYPCPCHTALEGERCHSSVQWVLTVGLTNHSEWYKGLTKKSTLEEVQMRLHTEKSTHCKIPCLRTPWS